MDVPRSGSLNAILSILLLVFVPSSSALRDNYIARGSTAQINSNSVLVALLDSQYTILSELVEKALLLQTLEEAVGKHNLTIFAPRNEALERDLDPEFKRFLLEPGNLRSLQTLLLFHVVPRRISAEKWPCRKPKIYDTLSRDKVSVFTKDAVKKVDIATVIHHDAVVRPDGIIHGIERTLIPRSVQGDFNRRRSLVEISAVLPQASPVIDPRSSGRKKPAALQAASAALRLPISAALSPTPLLDLSPAPAPAPGSVSSKPWFDGESQVRDFIEGLLEYGGYNEMADILVNLTSLSTEISRLVSQGYVLTVLAPSDEAMAKLTADQLTEAGAPELMISYHLIPEYQTEESMYNAVKRLRRVRYDTLRVPYGVVAMESDGSVKFGSGSGAAYLIDADIYTDGRISVQGISGVLSPSTTNARSSTARKHADRKTVTVPRRGKLLETTCWILGAVGQEFRFASCM